MAEDRNDSRTAPAIQITLTTWDKHTKSFLEYINFTCNQTTHDLLQAELNAFRQTIATPSTDNPADLPKLRAKCTKIIMDNVPEHHTPRLKNALQIFLLAFGMVLAATLAIGLVLILAAKFTALLGLVTLATTNFKTLFATSFTLATIGGLLAIGSMFAPRQHAIRGWEKFNNAISTPEALAPLAQSPTNR